MMNTATRGNVWIQTRLVLIVRFVLFVVQIFSVLTTYVFPDKTEFLFAFYHR